MKEKLNEAQAKQEKAEKERDNALPETRKSQRRIAHLLEQLKQQGIDPDKLGG